jgi:DHA1 family inner membrane transport protein
VISDGHPRPASARPHSTLNVANALGAWLGSLVLAAGYGYEWPSRVGAGLALAGVVLAIVSGLMDAASNQREVVTVQAGG